MIESVTFLMKKMLPYLRMSLDDIICKKKSLRYSSDVVVPLCVNVCM